MSPALAAGFIYLFYHGATREAPYLTFYEIVEIYSKVVLSFYICTPSVESSRPSAPSDTWYFPLSIIVAILVIVKWYLSEVLFSLMTKDVEHLFRCLFAVY